MWEKIKAFIFDKELYVNDEKKITSLHRAFQSANIVIFFITLIASFIVGVSGVLPALLIGPIVAIIDFVFIKIVLNIVFGWLYDIRVLRMNSATAPIEEPKD